MGVPLSERFTSWRRSSLSCENSLAATDLYAMGCVYYFCLTGKYPFDGDSMAKVMTAHLQGTYEPLDKLRPDLPRHLCQWVMWLMNRDMQNRPQSASEALDLLPLATSQDGHVYAVQAVDVEEQPEEEEVGTGEVHVVRPADLVADPGRQHARPDGLAPALRNTGVAGLDKTAITNAGPITNTTGVPKTNTGRIQPTPPSAATTGRVPTMNTGRVPRMNTGRVQTMSQGLPGPGPPGPDPSHPAKGPGGLQSGLDLCGAYPGIVRNRRGPIQVPHGR